MSGEGGQNRPQSNTMTNTKNNPRRDHRTLKKRREGEDLQELFVQWLTALLQNTRTRAVIRAMVEQHEMPAIDDEAGRTGRA